MKVIDTEMDEAELEHYERNGWERSSSLKAMTRASAQESGTPVTA